LAALVCFTIALLRKKPLRFSLKDHLFLFLQGIFLFSINYVLTYEGEQYLTSGLVALGFTTVIYFNTLGVWYFFGQKVKSKSLVGATFGALGLALIFSQEIIGGIGGSASTKGLILVLLAGLASSCGNLFSVRNHREKIPLASSIAFAMMYGTLFSSLIAIVRGEPWVFDHRFSYLISILYLSIFGSVVAFGAYLTLIRRVGAERAAYVNIIAPMLAMLLSTVVENFSWSGWSLGGVGLCLLGNYLVLGPERKTQVV
jgi:drug/metabolite transporter (DMT)-like permease